ncbi:MAG: serine hydrolase [Candidatus Xenobia bacterium]
MRRLALLVMAVSLLAASPARLQKVLDRAVQRGIPGLQACVTGRGIDWVGVAGVADKKGIPVTPTTRFRIASSSKTMVAATALILVGEGKLGLDDPVARYLTPEVASHFPRGITVRMLMNHTSGLEDYLGQEIDFDEAARKNPRREWTHFETLRYGYDLEPVGKPGQKHYYSNTNYILLGVVLEKVTGEPIGTTMQKRLFTPLGMRHTYCGLYARAPAETARGYAEEGDVSYYNPGDGLADGGVLSTAPDMAIFLRALLEKKLLKPAQQKALMTFVATDERDCTYGLGLARYDTEQGVCYGHDGSIDGYRSAMYYFEDSALVTVALGNTTMRDEVFDSLTESLEAAAGKPERD